MRASSSSRPLRYSHCRHLVQRALSLIAVHTNQTKSAVRDHYARLAHVSPDTIRAWQGGTARPHRADEIRYLARDAVCIAKLDLDWLRPFLWTVDASPALRQEILDELRPHLASDAKMIHAYPLSLPNGNVARAADAQDTPDGLLALLDALELRPGRAAITLVGGANGFDAAHASPLQKLFESTLIPFCEAHQIPVFTGGTESGVMGAIGLAYARTRATFPLIGVMPAGCVCLATEERDGDRAALEPNHSHFIFLPTDNWRDQAHWLAQAVTAFVGDALSLTVLANGGEISAYDVFYSLFASRPVIAIEGTGRLADQFAAALRANHPRHCSLGISVGIEDELTFIATLKRILDASPNGESTCQSAFAQS